MDTHAGLQSLYLNRFSSVQSNKSGTLAAQALQKLLSDPSYKFVS